MKSSSRNEKRAGIEERQLPIDFDLLTGMNGARLRDRFHEVTEFDVEHDGVGHYLQKLLTRGQIVVD